MQGFKYLEDVVTILHCAPLIEKTRWFQHMFRKDCLSLEIRKV
jgi:hypothetical protein